MDAFLRDKRGAAAIQAILLLPILIIVVIGGYEVWKVIYVRQILNDATYQAARFAAMQPKMRVEDDVLGVQFVDSTAYVEAMVERYIERYEVITNVDPDIDVTVTIPARPISRDDMDYHIFVDVELEWRIASEWGMHEWIESWRGESLLEMTAHAKIKGAKRMVFEE